MPYINADGTIWSGVGAREGWLWQLSDAAPFSLGHGAAGGIFNGSTLFGSSPRGAVWSPTIGVPWPQSIGHDDYAANIVVAGGPYWGASGSAPSIGDVPPSHETWKWWAIGNTGIRVMVLNGVYRAFWPTGNITDYMNSDVSVGDGCLITVESGLINLHDVAGFNWVPQQRPGVKYFVTTVRDAEGQPWLMYSSAELGKSICHKATDATQGYILDDLTVLGPVGPCGVTLADGRSVLSWARGPDQQGPVLQRRLLTLGVGMSPFVPVTPEPPIPPNPEPEPEPMPIVPDADFQRHCTQTAVLLKGVFPANMTPTDVAKQCENWGNRDRGNGVNALHRDMAPGAYAATRNERPSETWPTPTVDGSQAKYWDRLVKAAIALDKSEGLQR